MNKKAQKRNQNLLIIVVAIIGILIIGPRIGLFALTPLIDRTSGETGDAPLFPGAPDEHHYRMYDTHFPNDLQINQERIGPDNALCGSKIYFHRSGCLQYETERDANRWTDGDVCTGGTTFARPNQETPYNPNNQFQDIMTNVQFSPTEFSVGNTNTITMSFTSDREIPNAKLFAFFAADEGVSGLVDVTNEDVNINTGENSISFTVPRYDEGTHGFFVFPVFPESIGALRFEPFNPRDTGEFPQLDTGCSADAFTQIAPLQGQFFGMLPEGEIPEQPPEPTVDLCEGITCEDSVRECDDGETITCTNTCTDGVCSECTPDLCPSGEPEGGGVVTGGGQVTPPPQEPLAIPPVSRFPATTLLIIGIVVIGVIIFFGTRKKR